MWYYDFPFFTLVMQSSYCLLNQFLNSELHFRPIVCDLFAKPRKRGKNKNKIKRHWRFYGNQVKYNPNMSTLISQVDVIRQTNWLACKSHRKWQPYEGLQSPQYLTSERSLSRSCESLTISASTLERRPIFSTSSSNDSISRVSRSTSALVFL